MSDERQAYLETLGYADGVSFEKAARALTAKCPRDDESLSTLILDAARVLIAAPAMTRRERDRRLRVLASTLELSNSAFRAIADSAHIIPPEALNTIRAILPPSLRTTGLSQPSIAESTPGSAGTTQAVITPVGQRNAPNVAPAARQSSTLTQRIRRDDDYRASAQQAVALVGLAAEHDNNRSLLSAAKLKSLPVRDLSELWDLAPTGLCGFVIGPSVWTSMPFDKQRDALLRACSLSTVLFVRIAADGLEASVASTVADTAAQVCCGPVDGSRFCHGEGCQLTPTDIATLSKIADLLTAAERTSFFPLGLPEHDAVLLRLISTMRGITRITNGSVRQLGTRELAGGRSSARLYLVRPIGENRPLVIKLDGVEKLSDEVARYRRWIQPWEMAVTEAQLHIHLGSSAISYRLQSDPDAQQEPAPTLEDRLLLLRKEEIWSGDKISVTENDLTTALARAVDHLETLAIRSVEGANGDELWLHWPTENLRALGVVSNVAPDGRNPVGVADIVAAAARRVARLHNKAASHGDIHSRNILLVDRTPVFVDFARSGPNHPVYDLTCLDAAVRAHAMRLSGNERELSQAYHDIYVRGKAEADLRDSYPAVFSSASSRVAIATACRARAVGLRVLKTYGGGLSDYVAMVGVVSGFLLAHLAPNSGVERAVLTSVATSVLSG